MSKSAFWPRLEIPPLVVLLFDVPLSVPFVEVEPVLVVEVSVVLVPVLVLVSVVLVPVFVPVVLVSDFVVSDFVVPVVPVLVFVPVDVVVVEATRSNAAFAGAWRPMSATTSAPLSNVIPMTTKT